MTLASITLFLAIVALSCTGSTQAENHFVCYWESWSRYRAAPYTGTVNDIPVHLCTHLIYAFAGLDENTWKLKSLEPYWDLDLGGFKQLVALKAKNPQLKVSFAVGGWNEGAKKYSDLVSDRSRIKIFVDSVAEWIRIYGFDGIDLDWEYPADAARGGRSQDKQNLIVLLQALRESLGDKLLTIATCVPAAKIAAGYDVPEMIKYVDFIHVMTYDLRGGWDNVIGNHVSLHPSSNDAGPYTKLTVVQGMQNWIDAGAPQNKLILGLAFYGKSFTLRDPSNNKQGAPSGGNGHQGPVSQQDGTLFYFEICKKLKEGWTRSFDIETKSPHALSGDQWVGYEDVESVEHKINYVIQQNFAGVMLWAIDLDDASDSCGQGRYPLANAAFNALRGNTDQENEIDVDPSEPKPQPKPQPQPEPQPEPKPQPAPTSDCSTGKDFLPHYTKCSMFLRCVNRKPVEMSCPAGLLFDYSASICNWPIDVNPKLPEGCPDANP